MVSASQRGGVEENQFKVSLSFRSQSEDQPGLLKTTLSQTSKDWKCKSVVGCLSTTQALDLISITMQGERKEGRKRREAGKEEEDIHNSIRMVVAYSTGHGD